MNLSIILCNSLLYIVTSIFFLKKEGVCIHSFLWLYMTLFTLGSVYLLGSGLYFYVMDYPDFTDKEKLSVLPYLFNYLFCLLFTEPIKRISITRFRPKYIYTNFNRRFINFLLIIESFYILLKLYQSIFVYTIGFGNFHDLGGTVQDEILYGGNKILQYFNYLGRFVNMVFMPYVLFHQITGYLTHQISPKRLLVILTMYGLSSILVGVVSGSRASMFFAILNILFFFIFYFSKLNKKLVRHSLVVLVLFLCGFIVVSSIITRQRFVNSGTMTAHDNIARYLGEANLNLGFEYWNHVFKHTEGSFVFQDFKKLSSPDLRNYIGVHPEWFQTSYGCFFIDYGPIIPVIIALFLFLLGKIMFPLKMKTINLSLGFYYFSYCYLLPFGVIYNKMDLYIFLTILILIPIMDKFFTKRSLPSFYDEKNIDDKCSPIN